MRTSHHQEADIQYSRPPYPAPHLPAAPIRSSNDLKEMTVGILEIHSAATVVPVDFSSAVLARVRPILQPSIADAGQDLIEVVFAYQEGIMLGGNVAIVLVEVE